MTRRTFVTTTVLTTLALTTQAVSNLLQRSKDHKQDQTQQALITSQQTLKSSQKQVALNYSDLEQQVKTLEVPDVLPVLAMQDIVLRIICEQFSAASGSPVDSVHDFLLVAQIVALEGNEVFGEDFWSLVVERYLENPNSSEGVIRFFTHLS